MTPLSMVAVFLVMSPLALGGDLFSNDIKIPTADDIADSVLGKIWDKIESFFDTVANWILDSLKSINNWIDSAIYENLVPESQANAEEIKESPLWMSWILIKGVMFCIFWVFIIRMLISLGDVWIYILDLLPIV